MSVGCPKIDMSVLFTTSFLEQNRRGAASKNNYYINHHVGLVVLTDVVSPITTSAVKPMFVSTSPRSTSGRKPMKKASQNR